MLTRGFLGLVRRGVAVPRVPAALRFKSDAAGSDSGDMSAQRKLDELADFLESRPQETTRAPRTQRNKAQSTQKDAGRGPTKVFQNGHVCSF